MPMDSPQLEPVPAHDSQDVALQGSRPRRKDAQPRRNDAKPVSQSQYRHAAPSGPWPWMDFSNVHVPTATSNPSVHASWPGYPQNLFGNWTPDQVKRSKMLAKCSENRHSIIYWMDVDNDGKFSTPDMPGGGHTSTVETAYPETFWEILQEKRQSNIRVRSLFVDDLTEPVLQMLGMKYNIEPFFFTSSINWIPSRYQEALSHGNGDHITVTLPFVRTSPTPSSRAGSQSPQSTDNHINIQTPLPLTNDKVLFIDLLAIHMVRNVESSTIISYHPDSTSISSAKRLHSLVRLVGNNVYWQNIFSSSKDPTFLFLAILWSALYAWDESLESLYNHVMESEVPTESRVEHTRDLHTRIQAYLLHYESLLHVFELSVSFIKKTPNPAMESIDIYEEQSSTSKELMQKECENLLSEINRLEKRREMLSRQLKNAIDLAFANMNIRDSASMRQITYLTMIFLPASLIASVFGMNVAEINPKSLSLDRYVEVTIALMVLTFYIVVTLQTHNSFHEKGAKLHTRAAWPILLLWKAVERMEMFPDPQEKPKSVSLYG